MPGRSILCIIVLLCLPLVYASEFPFRYDAVGSQLSISSSAILKPSQADFSISQFLVNLSFFPYNTFQQRVIKLETRPEAITRDNVASFVWEKPKQVEFPFSLSASVETSPSVLLIKEKIPFPLGTLPDEVKPFLFPSETVDSDYAPIQDLAASLAGGEDDLFRLVVKLASWSKENIVYDLSTLTESVSQKASWVLENKRGVCDELTNLFIALNRALGIPAKFVSGVAYTDALPTGEGFGAHGWAEVYFPGYGWVPFDVTFGQFGHIDELHVKLKEALDADDPSTRYQWLGRNIDADTSPLDIKNQVISRKGNPKRFYSIEAVPEKTALGFGSYNLISVNVKNLLDGYFATEIGIVSSPEISIAGSQRQVLVLEPREEKAAYFALKAAGELSSGYLYTFPFLAFTSENVSSGGEFQVREDGVVMSLSDVESLIQERQEELKKPASKNVFLYCFPLSKEIYLYENTSISCSITNSGESDLAPIRVCYGQECSELRLTKGEHANASFLFFPSKAGAHQLAVKATGPEIKKTGYAEVLVLDNPDVSIGEISAPERVGYDDVFSLAFSLDKISMSDPVSLELRLDALGQAWEIDRLSQTRKFSIALKGSDLEAGKNALKITLEFEDQNGRTFHTEDEIIVHLVNLSLKQKIVLFFRGIPRKIGKLVSKFF